MSPEQLAEKVGVTRPALLHWQKETTDVMSVGVGPLRAFAQATGVNLEWVLTGRGDPLKTYTPTEEIAALIDKLARLQREDPKDFRMLERLINSAAARVGVRRPRISSRHRAESASGWPAACPRL
jgi:transcriptional regulator with XRE-family HTH domain